MVYGCLAAGNSLFTLMRAFLFAYGGICAAQVLHTRILTSILKVNKMKEEYTVKSLINKFKNKYSLKSV